MVRNTEVSFHDSIWVEKLRVRLFQRVYLPLTCCQTMSKPSTRANTMLKLCQTFWQFQHSTKPCRCYWRVPTLCWSCVKHSDTMWQPDTLPVCCTRTANALCERSHPYLRTLSETCPTFCQSPQYQVVSILLMLVLKICQILWHSLTRSFNASLEQFTKQIKK